MEMKWSLVFQKLTFEALKTFIYCFEERLSLHSDRYSALKTPYIWLSNLKIYLK